MTDMLGYSLLALVVNGLYAVTAVLLTIGVLWLGAVIARSRRLDILIELQKDNRAVALVVAAALVAVAVISSNAFGATGTDRYDRYFRHYGHRFFARAVDWRWFKAQAMAESGLDPEAVSPAGALGLRQSMPATSSELAAALRIRDLPLRPRHAVMMGIFYDRRLWGLWGAYGYRDRLSMTWASYNAGPGNIRRARRQAPCGDRWPCVAMVLDLVTGRHARETIDYVRRIEHYRKTM